MDSFIYFFKYWSTHLYFVFREHDRSVYFRDYFNFVLDSRRLIVSYHKISFFHKFYRGLKLSLFYQFFKFALVWDYAFYFFFYFFFEIVNSIIRFFFFLRFFLYFLELIFFFVCFFSCALSFWFWSLFFCT